jgi:hypothetical protein
MPHSRRWGGGAAGSVEHSKAAMTTILNDWAATNHVGESATSLLTLKVPHFHHEFVKKAATLAVERPERLPHVVSLLAELNAMGLVTETQMVRPPPLRRVAAR